MTKGYIMARTNHREAVQLKHISMMISMLHVMQSSANSCRKQSESRCKRMILYVYIFVNLVLMKTYFWVNKRWYLVRHIYDNQQIFLAIAMVTKMISLSQLLSPRAFLFTV